MGSELFTVPATDVPAEHNFGGILNTLSLTNLAAVARYVDIRFESGENCRLYGQEQLIITAEDTSLNGMSLKICSRLYTIAGDAVGTQLIRAMWTCKNDVNHPELVQV